MNILHISVIKTLSYFEIFEYPVTFSELYRYLHEVSMTKKELKKALRTIPDIMSKNGYYIFENKKELIRTRIEKKRISNKKMEKARSIANILRFVPTLELIGVSGSLSMHNSQKEDDIDLFFITQPHTLWISRFFVNCLLILLKEKRKKSDLVSSKICPNMYLTSDNLILARKNLYTAHEIAQLKVLYSKNHVYENFLAENKWIVRFLPNIEIPIKFEKSFFWYQRGFSYIDRLFFVVQAMYMRSYRTIEKIGVSYALFHPQDKTSQILTLYKRIYKKHLLASSKNFIQKPSQSGKTSLFFLP